MFSQTPLGPRTPLQRFFDRCRAQVKRRPTLMFGVPFVTTIVVASFGLASITQTRYLQHDQRVKTLSREEALGLQRDRRKLDVREEYYV